MLYLRNFDRKRGYKGNRSNERIRMIEELYFEKKNTTPSDDEYSDENSFEDIVKMNENLTQSTLATDTTEKTNKLRN